MMIIDEAWRLGFFCDGYELIMIKNYELWSIDHDDWIITITGDWWLWMKIDWWWLIEIMIDNNW